MLSESTAPRLLRQVQRLEGELSRARERAELAEAARARAEQAAREAWSFAKTIAHTPRNRPHDPT